MPFLTVSFFALLGFILGAAKRAMSLARGLRNRRQISRLAELGDRELKDIGLTRSDVLGALSVPLYRDPSRTLTCVAAGRTPGFPSFR